jgi:hypothetical protein
MSEELKQAGEEALAGVEVALELFINEKSDVIVEKVLAAVAVAIPGSIDDMVLAAAKPIIQPIVKSELLKVAEKVSEKV